MTIYQDILLVVISFFVIALASKQIGRYFVKIELPLISGFLFTGMLVGPYILGLITVEATEKLRFVDELSLAFIAFAAGSELYLKELKSRFKSITYVTAGLIVSTFILGSITVFYLSDFIPFMRAMSTTARLSVAILAGAILGASSPSSAIAVVNELRAKGPFTQTVLGVTMIMDVVVIALFALNSSIADALFNELPLDMGFTILLLIEFGVSVVIGYILAKILQIILSSTLHSNLKKILILIAGYAIFVVSDYVRDFSHEFFSFEILLEPLLVCMIGSFIATNFGDHRIEFRRILNSLGPPVYVAFFTLTGASLSLDVLAHTWQIAIILFLVRLVARFLGTFSAGVIAGDSMETNRVSWMSYVTQAGVGLGLAKEVVVEFPEWGTPFATIIIAIIVINQILGPPMFKWALRSVGEDHSRADVPEFDGIRDAIVFGLEGQSLALARMLRSHGWEVKIASKHVSDEEVQNSDVEIVAISEFTLNALTELNAGKAEAIVAMLSDDENYQICELAYEHFGTENLVVRLNDRRNFDRFHQLGVLIVEPGTAIVSLLDHFVRSPVAASLLLGMEENQDVVEVEVRNPDLHGITLRDLRLPLDIMILSVRRRGQTLVSHGFTRIEIGDSITLVGSLKSLEEVALRFDTDREYALLHLVEQVTAKELASQSLETEVKEIIREKELVPKDRFDRYIEESVVLDIRYAIGIDEFFNRVADSMSGRLGIEHDFLVDQLKFREKESSTAISPGIAIPHIIIDGERKFSILLARCRQGIMFSNSDPMVYAIFVLVGTRDERNFHLRALSAIAQIVQDPHFERKWLRARNEEALRQVILVADRRRHN